MCKCRHGWQGSCSHNPETHESSSQLIWASWMNILGSSKCRRKQQLELTWRDGRRCRQGRWGEAPGTCGNFWGRCARPAPHGREQANLAFFFTLTSNLKWEVLSVTYVECHGCSEKDGQDPLSMLHKIKHNSFSLMHNLVSKGVPQMFLHSLPVLLDLTRGSVGHSCSSAQQLQHPSQLTPIKDD